MKPITNLKMKVLATAILATTASGAWAGAVLDTGSVRMGVADDGGLGYNGVGLSYGPSGDAIMPGCLCEGWGAAGNGTSGYTYAGSATNFTSSVFTMGGSAAEAQSTVTLGNGLVVNHNYTAAAGGSLFQIDVSIQNTTAATITDTRYSRTLDWDVPPGHFADDFTTIWGGTASGPGGNVLHTSFDPFAVPDPLTTRTYLPDESTQDVTGDWGAYFILGFGDLAAGESVDFTTYIGATDLVSELLSAFASVNIEAYSYSYDDAQTSAFGWGFADVGLPPVFEPPTSVPEPSSLLLFGAGLLGLGISRRKARV